MNGVPILKTEITCLETAKNKIKVSRCLSFLIFLLCFLFLFCFTILLYHLFVCSGFFAPLENFSLKLRSHLYRLRAAKYNLYSALMAILNSEDSLACQTYCVTCHPFIMVTSEDSWHSHLLPSVCDPY